MTENGRPPISNGPAEPKGTLAKAEPSWPSMAELADIAAMVRRRRAAALRLPPLPSGYRDPLDELLADAPAQWRAPLCRHGHLGECRSCWKLAS